jgi:O-antigen/teichoic acid export membrane protein
MAFGTARRITANFASLVTAEITSKIVQALVFIYLARFLTKDDFGIFSFSLSFSLIVMIIADFGLTNFLVREISRNKKDAHKYFSNGLLIRMTLSIAAFAVGYAALVAMDYPVRTIKVACIMMAFAAMQTLTDLHFTVFRAFEKMHFEMLLKVFRMLSIGALVIYLTKSSHGIMAASLVFPLVEIAVLLIAFSIVNMRFAKMRFDFDIEFSKTMLKDSSVLFLSLLFATLYLYVDVIMLSKLRTNAEVGIYSAAANIIIAFIFIPQMYCNSIYPAMSRYFITSKKSLKFIYERSFKYLLILGLPCALGLLLLSQKIIDLLYGPKYAESAIVMTILSGYIFLKFLNPLTGYTLIAINKQNTRLIGQGTAAAVNIILNLILIPNYGIIGAAASTLITEIIFFAMYCSFIISNGFEFTFIRGFIHKIAIAGTAMTFAVMHFDNIFAAAMAGGLAYGIAIIVLRTIDENDMKLLDRIKRNI